MTKEFTHTTADGSADMVDVGGKPTTRRHAAARGEIHLGADTIAAVRAAGVEKGDVLATARIGAIQAVKHTWEAIPLCHQIPITNVDVDIDVHDDRITIETAVDSIGKTGCEMEALHGVTTGLTVVWDMVKALEKTPAGSYPDTEITDVRVVAKEKHALADTE